MPRLLRRHAASARLRRRGISVILLIFVLLLLVVFVSLAVDMGRVRLAHSQLQTAADSSARTGAGALAFSSAHVIDQATEAAAANPTIDTETENADHLGERTNPGVQLEAEEDIIFGFWDKVNKTFEERVDNPLTEQDERRTSNAVKTWARRLETRDNPVPLIFAPVVGVMHTSIEKTATAYISGGPSYFSFVGIDWVQSNGNGATIRNKSGALYGGGVGSDGDINLGNGDVYGDARAGIGHQLIQGPNSVVTGWVLPLDYSLAPLYPHVTLVDAAGATNANALYKKNQPLTLAGGPKANPTRYIFNGNLDHPDPLSVTNGYAILYVNGDVNVQGNGVVNAPAPSDPAKLTIKVIGNHSVDLGGNSEQFMHLYAPTSTVRVHGTPGYYGTIVGKTLSFIGTSNLYSDESYDSKRHFLIRLVE